MTDLQTRTLGLTLDTRAADAGAREVSGVAVPYGIETRLWGDVWEVFEPGSADLHDRAVALLRHDHPIGRIVTHEQAPEGLNITMRLSDTPAASEALTLARDGVLALSIGFQADRWTTTERDDGTTLTAHQHAIVREVSLVPVPAYEAALVTSVRHATTTHQETPMPDTRTTDAPDLSDVRQSLADLSEGQADLSRRLDTLHAAPEHAEPEGTALMARQFQSFGHYVQAAVRGDETARRAFEGMTTDDTPQPGTWVGTLADIMRQRQPVLSAFTHTRDLPAKGMSIEYGYLSSNSIEVDEQVAQGDPLAYGGLTLGTASAPVRTFGGYTAMSRQAVERTSNPAILDLVFRAYAEEYARAIEAYARGLLLGQLSATVDVDGIGTPVTARVGSHAAFGATDIEVVETVLDLSEHFDDTGRALTGILASRDVLLGLYAIDARDSILRISGTPGADGQIGTVTVRPMTGNLAGLTVTLLPNASAGTAVAYDSTAIRVQESPGAPFRLSDDDITNLTKQVSVYGYAAGYVQRADGLVNVGTETFEP